MAHMRALRRRGSLGGRSSSCGAVAAAAYATRAGGRCSLGPLHFSMHPVL